ncbi:hypothetical protein DM02DRAFT_676112 [Periconia macrospinosa]|uniref:Uncharacterized protein n=1 Tax=Periconia macrospinosa TaxID=97972 RepID=A0A2V1D8Z5_9PLEO|nr:hypothetical protein DM02DRAFT_676112 [Periconia macrospinosa]
MGANVPSALNPESRSQQTLHGANPSSSLQQIKVPRYLDGKNPYGRILEEIDHPYRESKQLSTSPPSQLGSNVKGRPRTTGSFNFKTRTTPQHAYEITKRGPSSLPPQLLDQTVKKTSFQVAKRFFEDKANVPPTSLPRPSKQPNTSGYVLARKNFFESKARESQKEPPSLPKRLDHTQQFGLVRHNRPNTVIPKVVLTMPNDFLGEEISNSRRRSTNVFSQPQRVPQALGSRWPGKTQHSKVNVTPRDVVASSVKSHVEPSNTVAGDISYDGTSRDNHNTSQRTTSPTVFPIGNDSLKSGYYSIEVLNDIDNDGGCGHRRTHDFGYHNARIRSNPTLQTYRAPLQDPGKWTKRSCGHFSSVRAIESREEAVKTPCKQCSIKSTDSPAAHLNPIQSSHAPYKSTRTYSSVQDKNIPSSTPYAEDLVQDLGQILDSILQEHQNTLQKVIHNLDSSRQQQQRQPNSPDREPPFHSLCESVAKTTTQEQCQDTISRRRPPWLQHETPTPRHRPFTPPNTSPSPRQPPSSPPYDRRASVSPNAMYPPLPRHHHHHQQQHHQHHLLYHESHDTDSHCPTYTPHTNTTTPHHQQTQPQPPPSPSSSPFYNHTFSPPSPRNSLNTPTPAPTPTCPHRRPSITIIEDTAAPGALEGNNDTIATTTTTTTTTADQVIDLIYDTAHVLGVDFEKGAGEEGEEDGDGEGEGEGV